MSTLSGNQIGLIVSLVIALALIAIYVLRYLRHKRAKLLEEKDNPSWVEDTAHNQINTTRAVIERSSRDGLDVSLAKSRLDEAEIRLKEGDYGDAARLARSARDMVQAASLTPRATRQRVVTEKKVSLEDESLKLRDLSRKVGEPDTLNEGSERGADAPAPTALDAPEELPPMQEFRKKVERNLLESRFERQMLENDLKTAEGKSAEEARRLLAQADKAFQREDYTESLRLAMRGRRLLGSPDGSRIAISPGTTVDAPPEQPSPSALRSSAPSPGPEVAAQTGTGRVAASTVKCPRCGKDNPTTNRFCRACGQTIAEAKCPRCQKTVDPEDTFCGSCGTPLGANG